MAKRIRIPRQKIRVCLDIAIEKWVGKLMCKGDEDLQKYAKMIADNSGELSHYLMIEIANEIILEGEEVSDE